MSTSIRDKAKGQSKPPKVDPKPASAGDAKPKAKVPEAKPPAPEKVASVTSIGDRAVEDLTDEQVERMLARSQSGPGVAGLAATRVTKTEQIQYDGKTEDGFIVRVWAPKGSPLVTKARLDIEA